ncbi:MAG: hypothetical protein MEQ07_10890 [Aquimonas sp.]|nr:hypothetical protein [Aquimonas sp.]
MSRAQRRRIEKQQAKAERSEARRAAAAARSRRERERRVASSQMRVFGPVGGLLWDLAWWPLLWWVWPLSAIGRLMGIDTSERGPPRERPQWMPAPDPQATAKRER